MLPSGVQMRFWGRLGAHLEVPTLRKHQKHYCFSPFSKSRNFAHRSSFWTTLAAFWCHLLQKAPNLGSPWSRDWPGNASFWSPETTWALHAPKSPHRVPKSPGNGSKCLQKELKKRTKHLCPLRAAYDKKVPNLSTFYSKISPNTSQQRPKPHQKQQFHQSQSA